MYQEWITDGSKPNHTNFVLIAMGQEVWVAYWSSHESLWHFNDAPSARPEIVNAWMELPSSPWMELPSSPEG